MDALDSLFLESSNRIGIHFWGGSDSIDIAFSTSPSEEVLSPINRLVDSGKFAYQASTIIKLERGENPLARSIHRTSTLTVTETANALAALYRERGFLVSLVNRGGKEMEFLAKEKS